MNTKMTTKMSDETEKNYSKIPKKDVEEERDQEEMNEMRYGEIDSNTLTDKMKQHFREIYDSLVEKGDNTLSQKRFEDWLLKVQKVSTIEKWPKKINGGYSFDDWLNTLYEHNDFLGAQRIPGPKDLTKTLSNYYISSSHNTYLSGNQLISRSKTEAYRNVLRRGCRCIEVDVHNGDNFNSKEIAEGSKSPRSLDTTPTNPRSKPLSTKITSLLDRATWKRKRSKGNHITTDADLLDEEKNLKTRSISSCSSVSSSSSDESNVIPGEPIVMHGWTLTAPVGFRAVCKTIGEEGFQNSELPIIVSLEVHVDLDQQETMVKIMKEEWGDMLIQAPIYGCDPNERLPRLEQLKRKILVKVKKCQQQELQGLQFDSTPGLGAVGKQTDLLTSKAPKTINDRGNLGNEAVDGPSSAGDKKKAKICKNLSNLGVYTQTEHFSHSFNDPIAQRPQHIFSIGESDLIELSKAQRQELFTHNRNYIVRTYPAARRINSSNPNPIFFWTLGVQIVAMNWQKLDQGIMLNEGMFSGEQGWVLKPPGYYSSNGNGNSDKNETRVYIPAPATIVNPIIGTTVGPAANESNNIDAAIKTANQYIIELKITILAGQHMPVPIDTTVKRFCPYVCGELHTGEDDMEISCSNDQGSNRSSSINGAVNNQNKQKTPYLEGDQLDFGKKGYQMIFPIRERIEEELSFFRFKIQDSRYLQDDLSAWACIRLDRLQSGYRLVHLRDSKSQLTAGLLLVKIEKEYSQDCLSTKFS